MGDEEYAELECDPEPIGEAEPGGAVGGPSWSTVSAVFR